MIISCMAGMSLTSYAVDHSESFTTNTGAGTYTGTNIEISGWVRSDGDGDVIGLGASWTIKSLHGEIITRIDLTIGWYGGCLEDRQHRKG